MKKQRNVSLLKTFLIAFFSSWGLFLSISTKDFKNSNIPDTKSSLVHFLSVLRVSFHDSRYTIFFVFIALVFLVYFIEKHVFEKREKIVSVITGIIIATAFIISNAFTDPYSDLSAFYINKVQVFRVLIKFFGLIVLSTAFTELFFILMNYLTNAFDKAPVKMLNKKENKKSFLLLSVAFVVARIPYFIVFYPGISSSDTTTQLKMFYGHWTLYYQYTPAPTSSMITNHHPYFTTLIYAFFSQLGIKLGDVNVGFALYSVCQIVLYAVVFAGLIIYLNKIAVSKKIQKIVFWFLMLFPLISLSSITMLKDTLFGIFNLVFLVMCFEIVRSKGKILKSVKFNIFFFIDALLVMLTKNQGIYMIAIVAVIYIIAYRKYWKQICATLLVAIILFQGAYINVLLPALNVAPGGKQEALSVPFQQTARYVVEHGDEVTEEEKEAINAILPYDRLAYLYDAKLSDDVKTKFNQRATKEQLMSYFKVWFKMFLKHPLTYVNATLNNTYGFYSMGSYSSLGYYELLPGLKDCKELDGVISNDDKRTERTSAKLLNLVFQTAPGFNILFSHGMYSIFVLLLCADMIRRKREKYLLSLLFPVLTVLVCVASPANGNFRYIYPLVLMLPFVFAVETIPDNLLPKYNKKKKDK